ncbi:hypothetical protein OF83DRAFT_930990 [Amylostereum chailletii]|nr:hypothetical protein OF83DRAFT_930990 [Amylostereum chailletii]
MASLVCRPVDPLSRKRTLLVFPSSPPSPQVVVRTTDKPETPRHPLVYNSLLPLPRRPHLVDTPCSASGAALVANHPPPTSQRAKLPRFHIIAYLFHKLPRPAAPPFPPPGVVVAPSLHSRAESSQVIASSWSLCCYNARPNPPPHPLARSPYPPSPARSVARNSKTVFTKPRLVPSIGPFPACLPFVPRFFIPSCTASVFLSDSPPARASSSSRPHLSLPVVLFFFSVFFVLLSPPPRIVIRPLPPSIHPITHPSQSP